MHDDRSEASVVSEALVAAAREVDLARGQLDLEGGDAVDLARDHLETAIAILRPLAADDDVPSAVRRAAEQSRATLSSHLLAAHNLQAAGVRPATVARLLRRGTETKDLQLR